MSKWKELLGSGSYGFVHKIVDPDTGEATAVKVNYVERSMDFIGSYREIDLLTRLKHPFIINLLKVTTECPMKIPNKRDHKPEDKGMREDPIYMIFEAGDFDLEVGSLDDTGQVLCAIAQLLLAVEFLHYHNYIHRDIKPGNLVHFKNNNITKLIDFGFCKHWYPGLRSTPSAITGSYRPPELFTKKEDVLYGKEADIWSVGMTWLYLITKKEPDIDDTKNIQRCLNEIYSLVPCDLPDVDFSRRFPLISKRPTWENTLEEYTELPGLKDILSKMLSTDPSKRPSASECLDHPIFAEYASLIAEVRSMALENVHSSLQPYTITECLSPEREIMMKELKTSNHITMRMIFQAINLIDRYIDWRIQNNIPRPSADVSIERARIIMYIVYKYFNITIKSGSFEEVFPQVRMTSAKKQELAYWEYMFVEKVLKFCIYRPTPFEMCEGNPQKIKEMLFKYKQSSPLNGYTVTDN